MKRFSVLKIAKKIIVLAAVVYLFLVASFYSYFAIVSGPFGAVTITDHYLISGPVKRALSPAISDEELIGLLREEKSQFKELVAINAGNCLSDSWGRPLPEVVTIATDTGLLKVYGLIARFGSLSHTPILPGRDGVHEIQIFNMEYFPSKE